jgi:hypothetical protein
MVLHSGFSKLEATERLELTGEQWMLMTKATLFALEPDSYPQNA